MAKTFMIQPLKCIILVFLIISFCSCSTLKQAGIHPPMKMDTSPPKTVSSSKSSIKKSDTIVQKEKKSPTAQTKEKTVVALKTTQPEVNTILKTEPEHKQNNDNNTALNQNNFREEDGNTLMSEYLFKKSFGYSFGNPNNNIAEDIRKEIEMALKGFGCCEEESDESLDEADSLYSDTPYNYGKDDLEEESAVKEDSDDDWKFYSNYSKKWGLELDGTEDKQLIMAIDEWLGTRYKWGGCSKDDGVDCSCLVKSIYEDVYGIELSRSSSNIFYNDLIPVKKEELQEGDLICFKTKKNRISHIGLYLKDNKFVHASRTRGVIIDDLNGEYYKKRFFSGGRVTEKLRMSLRLSKQSSDRR